MLFSFYKTTTIQIIRTLQIGGAMTEPLEPDDPRRENPIVKAEKKTEYYRGRAEVLIEFRDRLDYILARIMIAFVVFVFLFCISANTFVCYIAIALGGAITLGAYFSQRIETLILTEEVTWHGYDNHAQELWCERLEIPYPTDE
jgi:hypothetical protein